MTTGEELVAFARAFVTTNQDRISYKYGDHPDPSDKNPTTFDCSGFVRWVVGQFDGASVGPAPQTGYQYRYCRDNAGEIDLTDGYRIPGALLFRSPEEGRSHVAISVGDGIHTLEAVGTGLGVGVREINTTYRTWNNAVRIPGITYSDLKNPSIAPRRTDCLLDTRPGQQLNYTGDGKPPAGRTVPVTVRGSANVPADAVAVMLNVTAAEATNPGFITVFDADADLRPTASNMNLDDVNPTRAALVTVPIRADGTVNLYTKSGAHFVVHAARGFAANDGFVPVSPVRILETRASEGQVGYAGAKPVAGQTLVVPIRDHPVLAPLRPSGGTTIADAVAVVLTLTGDSPTGPGYVTVWPTDKPRPQASNLNLAMLPASGSGPTANQVIVPVAADGTISVFTQSGADLILDLSGYFTAGSVFKPVTPARLLDTRSDSPPKNHSGVRPGAGEPVHVKIVGEAGMPASGIREVLLNITATNTSGPGYVAAWAKSARPPEQPSSILSICRKGQTVPNLALVPVGDDGMVTLTAAPGADLIADVFGYTTG